MLLALRGQRLRVHLSCKKHGGMSIMQLSSPAEESADGSANTGLTLL